MTRLNAVVSCVVVLLVVNASQGALTFYATRGSFDAANPNTVTEDFENANVAAGADAGIPNPLNSSTNNAVFAAGSVINGFTMVTVPNTGSSIDIFVGGDGRGGNATKHVSSNGFLADIDLFLSPTSAVGLDLAGFNGVQGAWTVDVYGASGLLGTQNLPTGGFFGVSSNMESITRLFLDKPNTGGVIDNLTFAIVPEPASLLLGAIGFLTLAARRKRA